jgi:hypothetical protein
MWQSFKEFLPAVLRHWWAIVPGVALGAWSLFGLFRPTVRVAEWVWLAVFGVGLILAMFLAFHDVRKRLGDVLRPELASFDLVGRAKWSISDNYPYNPQTGRLETIPEPEHFEGNPELDVSISADFQAMAHGGTNGGYLYDIEWHVGNLPSRLGVILPDIPKNGIGLEPRQSVPFKPVLTLVAERLTYPNLRAMLESMKPDLVLVATYGRKGSAKPGRSELLLPHADILLAFKDWDKE